MYDISIAREERMDRMAEAVGGNPMLLPTKRQPNNRTVFGHMHGSMSGLIDDAIIEGASEAYIVRLLMLTFGRDENHAKTKLRDHLGHLKNEVGVVVLNNHGQLTVDTENSDESFVNAIGE